MAATDIVITGLYYAIGAFVTVTIAGLDCGDYTVSAQGTVTVPINSDPDKLCNGANLITQDVGPWDKTTYGDLTTELTLDIGGNGLATIYVPVAVGFVFPSYGQVQRPVTEQQIKSPQGPGTGKKRRVFNAAILGSFVGNANALMAGTNIADMHMVPATTLNGTLLPHNVVFSGVAYFSVTDSDSYDGQISWYMLRPYPCIINTINSFLDAGEH